MGGGGGGSGQGGGTCLKDGKSLHKAQLSFCDSPTSNEHKSGVHDCTLYYYRYIKANNIKSKSFYAN